MYPTFVFVLKVWELQGHQTVVILQSCSALARIGDETVSDVILNLVVCLWEKTPRKQRACVRCFS